MGSLRYRNGSPKPTTTLGDKWYTETDGAGYKYFTPFLLSVAEFGYIGDGTETPTPAQIVEYMRKNGSRDYRDPGWFIRYTKNAAEPKSVDVIPPGAYRYDCSTDTLPERLTTFKLRTDHYEDVGGSHASITEKINGFLSNEAIYRELEMLYKLGILCYGGQGEGKTAAVRNIVYKLTQDEDALVIWLGNRLPSSSFLEKLKAPDMENRLKVFIFEEIYSTIDYEDMDELLNFLDGEKAPDSAIIIATTNYPEKIPANIVDRPSRFDHLEHFKAPNIAQTRKLLKNFLKRDASEEEVLAAKGLSTAAMKEAALRLHIHKVSFAESAKALHQRTRLVKKAFAESKDEVGF